MQGRLVKVASALARVVLVVVAFGLAVGSIGLASARGFCPEVETALAMPLGTIVEEPSDDEPDPEAPDPAAPDPNAPADGGEGEAPAEDTEPAPSGDADGACPGGAQRCLPPLWSSILILGETDCHDQAGARLRGVLVPSFVGSTVLLAVAWWLRPGRLRRSEHDEARL